MLLLLWAAHCCLPPSEIELEEFRRLCWRSWLASTADSWLALITARLDILRRSTRPDSITTLPYVAPQVLLRLCDAKERRARGLLARNGAYDV